MYKSTLIQHRNQDRIALFFRYDKELIMKVRKIKGANWSATKNCWHIPDTKENRQRFNIAINSNKKLSIEKQKKLEEFVAWMASKRYSKNTIKTYMEAVRVFLVYYTEKKINVINNADVIRFNNDYILKNKLSASYQNQFVNGLRLFYKIVEFTNLDISLVHRPKVEKHLPHILSKQEIKLILEAHINFKHRTMLSLIYACGLRRGELLNLKPKNILSDRNLLHIFQSKGNKDRVVPISDKTIEMLRTYYKGCKPKVWLFEGQVVGKQYSPTSLQEVLKSAVKKAGIKKKVTLHWLRHSYATHLLESGTDIRYIQELLGHNSSRTTEIYTHVSNRDIQNITSPFDLL